MQPHASAQAVCDSFEAAARPQVAKFYATLLAVMIAAPAAMAAFNQALHAIA